MQEQTYTCQKCDAEFPNQEALNDHNMREHGGSEQGQGQPQS
jgi:hypothetical protein